MRYFSGEFIDKKAKWEVLKRTKLIDSKYLKVYRDEVKLPNGKINKDYTLIEKPSIVSVVATDAKNKVITLKEYKHGAGKVLNVLPAGIIEKGESPVEAARRELEEETGFSGGKFEYVGTLYDYPARDMHTISVVRAKNVSRSKKQQFDEGEYIERVRLIPIQKLKQEITDKKWQSSGAVASLAVSKVLF